MAAKNYGQTRNEKVWIKVETTFNTLVQPAVTDAVIPLPGLALPAIMTQYVPSLERRPTPGVAELIARKKPPGAFTLPFYAKFGAAAGTPPSYGVLLKDGFGAETIVGATSVTYAPATAIEETSFSIWHAADDNLLRGFRGCKVNTIELLLSGSDEGRLTFAGFAGNEVFAGVTTLGAAVADGVVTTITVVDSTKYQVGPAASDSIRIKIESEAMLVTAINYATHVLTVTRGVDGTTAVAHSNGLEVAPYLVGADTDPADTIAPITLGAISLNAVTYLGISARMLIDNKLQPVLDEYGESVLTHYVRASSREVTGNLRFYSKQATHSLLSAPGRALVEDLILTAGSAGTALLTVNADRLRFLNPPVLDQGGPEFIWDFSYQALETGGGTGNDETTWALT